MLVYLFDKQELQKVLDATTSPSTVTITLQFAQLGPDKTFKATVVAAPFDNKTGVTANGCPYPPGCP